MKKGLLDAHRIIAEVFFHHRYYPRDRDALRTTLIENLCQHYAREYPGFDREEFIALCGQAEPHRRTLVEGAPIPHEAIDIDPPLAAYCAPYIDEARD